MDIVCPSGLAGEIRGLTVKDGRYLTDRSVARSGLVLDRILQSCWLKTTEPGVYDIAEDEKKVDWQKILVGDRDYALMQIRIEGIGSDVEITGCGKAVNVAKPGTSIKNSKIWDNKIGVEIGSSVVGTDIEGSLIYQNDDEITTGPDDRQRYDGVKIVDGAAHQVLFYSIINNEPT